MSDGKARLNKFINIVDEREKMLEKAKHQLSNENTRNERLDASF